ncbi:MAG: rod shape-determining protein MreC [Candidatus Paceibacteria bacterium]
MNNYPLHHKERGLSAQAGNRLFTKVFLGVLLVVLILALVQIIFPNSLSGVSNFVAAPFWKSKNFTVSKVANSAELLRSKRSLIEENNNLKAEIELNNLKLLSLDLFKEENIRLKELFDRQISSTDNSILGVVLVRPSASLYDTLVIDVGAESDVSEGDYVFVSGDIFIGRINEVYKNTSLVKLFSSPGEITQVRVGLDGVSASAEGVGGGNFIAELPRGIGIEEGDMVVMPNISTRVFAVVEEIDADPSDPFLTVLFKNPINLNDIKWVQVLTGD